MIRNGKRRHLITAYSRTENRGSKPTYTAIGTVWGSIEQFKGDEKSYGSQVIAKASHTIQIRYLAGVGPQTQFQWNSRKFNVIAPPKNLDERDRYLICICEEVQR